MSLITLDTFTLSATTNHTTVVTVTIDSATGIITASQTGPPLPSYNSTTPTNRTNAPGDIISARCIGFDYYTFIATYDDPFVSASIQTNSALCGFAGGGGKACDLVILTSISTSPTNLNNNDGSVSVSVSTSNTPAMFALNGDTPVAGTTSGAIISKNFNNLSPGLYTVTITDALGCITTQAFTVQPFKTNLVATPATTTSRWSALFNPIVFNYQRKDYYIIAINNSSVAGMTEFQVSPQLSSADVTALAGQQMYVSAPGYNFVLTPAGIDNTTNPSTTTFTFTTPLNGTDITGAFLNVYGSKPAFKFRTQITSGYDGATNVITADHAPNLKGFCRADISKYLRTLLQPKDELPYTDINYRDANISASYTVQFCTVNNNVPDGNWQSAGDPFYVTYSAMQIGNPNGGNMAPYVTQPGAGQTAPAKFLNDFTHPRFYTDMPFDLSFIYSEKIAGYQIKLGGNGIDINGNITGALGEVMLLNEDGSVLLNEDGSKLLIEKDAPGVLLSKLGVNRLRITQGIPAGSIYLDVFLFYTDSSGNNIPVTESKRLLLDSSPCNGLPYEYLKWMGPSGGWLYYMLIKNQIHEINTSNAVVTERFISDYASADSTQQLISIDAQKKITAGKNDVHMAEAEVLAGILYGPKVYRLVDAATNTWQGVMLDTTSLTLYQTYEGRGDFEISYLLPEVNVQRA